MADNTQVDEAGVPYVTVTRVLEYYGPKAWVEKTLKAGHVPAQGSVEFDKIGSGVGIRSGLVNWESVAHVANGKRAPYLPSPGGN